MSNEAWFKYVNKNWLARYDGSLQKIAARFKYAYRDEPPFPNIVFNDFFNEYFLQEVLDEFPDLSKANQQQVKHFENQKEMKFASIGTGLFGTKTKEFVNYLNSPEFIGFLQELTGIKEPLIADHEFRGGGLHEIRRGGFLKLHADFNRSEQEINGKKLHRRLNLLIYLNHNWKDEYNGHFELWNKDLTKCVRKITPAFNTMAIFSTTSESWHGHPDPLNCPPHMRRISIALYYYSEDRPAEEKTDEHITKFVPRKGHVETKTMKDKFSITRVIRKIFK